VGRFALTQPDDVRARQASLDGLPRRASTEPGKPADYLLELHNVTKSFSGRQVLRGIDMRIPRGVVHGLVGNNGAGKSTLVKIITGTYSASSSSSISINGRLVASGFDEHTAQSLGVRVVHQEAPLIDSFTVAEMVAVLHGYPTRLGAVRWRQLKRETQQLLDNFHIRVEPTTRAAFLSAAERALVTLGIALVDTGGDEGAASLVILDEATASVPSEEAKQFLNAVRGVAESGRAVLMVSHRLHEIADYCDSVTVLNDGLVVYDGPMSGMSVRELGERMAAPAPEELTASAQSVTKSLPESWGFESSGPAPAAAPVLSVSDLQGSQVRGVTFSIGPGEIVGMSGLFGSGVSEIARLVSGIDAATHGAIELDGAHALTTRGRPHEALQAGVAYLSSDRAHEGGISTLSMQENVILPTVSRYWGKIANERKRVAEALSLFDIRPRRPELPFGVLSGGNQQKSLLAKILLTHPRLVVLDDPTVGVDPQSREIIFAVLREFVSSGRGALVASSEPDQLAKICDRVLVIDRGRIVREFVGAQITATDIALASS
jgi:ABC-type sugar transport system ATPase subunit